MNQVKHLSVKQFFGLSVVSDSENEVLNLLRLSLEEKSRVGKEVLCVFTPNPEQMVLARENSRFYKNLEAADLLLPDGSGLVWAMNRVGGIQAKRLSGRALFHDLLELAAKKNYKVFLLGGEKGSSQSIIESYEQSWQFDDGPRENTDEALKKISAYKPDLLFVAFGAPHQEEWVIKNREVLRKADVGVAMVVGGAFEYEAGSVPKIPRMVQDLHLEWLMRLVVQPWRWKRQLKGARFFLDVILGKYDKDRGN